MVIIHHNDADGLCAAYLVRRQHEITGFSLDKVYPEIKYAQRCHLPNEKPLCVEPNETVYIVDYSLPLDEFKELRERTQNIVWIDHHISAINKYNDLPISIKGLRSTEASGCMLTWIYFNRPNATNYSELITTAPKYVQLINDWDTWTHNLEGTKDFITCFNANLDSYGPDSNVWGKLDNSYIIKEMIEQGKIMNQFKEGWAKSLRKTGFYVNIEDGDNYYSAFCLNCGNINSTYFGSYEGLNCDLFIAYSFNGDCYKFSMYSLTVDVGAICTKFGGGGHKGAAGFTTRELPFEITTCVDAKGDDADGTIISLKCPQNNI